MQAFETSRVDHKDFTLLYYEIRVGDFAIASGNINCQAGDVDKSLELVVLDYKAARSL